MFDRIKKAFSRDSGNASLSNESLRLADGPVSEWAGTQGFAFAADPTGRGVSLEGLVGVKRWRLEVGRSTREFIIGQELRARAQLGIDENLSVLVMSRRLKDFLEKKAYQIYTDGLQTSVDSTLPQEMRWLAMFDEVGWEGLPEDFWSRFSVLSDRRETAVAWLQPALARLMLDWPSPAPSPEVPFMVLLLSGKAYLRMEYTPASLATLQHAALIFTSACEAALEGFPATPA